MVSNQPSASRTHTHKYTYAQYRLKKKIDSQTCSGHKTAQSKVQLRLECFSNDEQGDKETSSPSQVSLTANSWLFAQVVFSSVQGGKRKCYFPTEERLKGSHYAFDPGGAAK